MCVVLHAPVGREITYRPVLSSSVGSVPPNRQCCPDPMILTTDQRVTSDRFDRLHSVVQLQYSECIDAALATDSRDHNAST